MARKPAARLGDIGGEHDDYPSTPIISGSDITCNGRRIARQGDSLVPHGRAHGPPHPRTIAAGSASVLVNGKPWARQGDPIDCGGTITGGSADVLVGDAPISCNPIGPAEWEEFVTMLHAPEGRPASEHDRSRLAARVAVRHRGAEGGTATWHGHYRRRITRREALPDPVTLSDPAEREGLRRARLERDREREALGEVKVTPTDRGELHRYTEM